MSDPPGALGLPATGAGRPRPPGSNGPGGPSRDFLGRVALAGALAAVLLVLLPLAGLLAAALDPPGSGAARDLREVWRTSGALRLLARTLALASLVSVFALPLGTWLAWTGERFAWPGRRPLAVLALLPLAVPSYVLAATLRQTLGPGGPVGTALGLGRFTGFGPAALVLVVITVPYVQLLVAAALARSSAAEEEAARLLGASPARVFRTVVLPRLRPALAFTLLITSLYVVSDFGAVSVLDCQVLTWRLYQAIDHQELGTAACLGFAVLAGAGPLFAAARWIHGRAPVLSVVANPRRPARRPLRGAALAGAYAAHGLVAGLGVVLPALVLGSWVASGLSLGRTFAPLVEPLRHTLFAVGLGASVTLVLAFFPAWVVARRGGRLGRGIETGAYLSSALPGVLTSFGLLLATLTLSRVLGGPELYARVLGSGALLAAGYAMLLLAQAYGGLKDSVLALDPRHEETVRSLGVGPLAWFLRVALPALRPGIRASLVVLVLALLKELPVTLLLGGFMGLRPLSFRVYDRYQEAFLHDAGLAGLLQLALALVLVWLARVRQEHG